MFPSWVGSRIGFRNLFQRAIRSHDTKKNKHPLALTPYFNVLNGSQQYGPFLGTLNKRAALEKGPQEKLPSFREVTTLFTT